MYITGLLPVFEPALYAQETIVLLYQKYSKVSVSGWSLQTLSSDAFYSTKWVRLPLSLITRFLF
jgi:hypothetical protein